MKKIRKAAVAVGVAGALSVGALVAVPALAGSDDAPVDSPARYGQIIDDDDEVTPNPNCTGDQERSRDREQDRDQLRIYMQDRNCDGAQLRHQEGRAMGNGPGPGQRSGPGPGPGDGECPYAPTD
jgi:hypothetical protein